MHIRKILARRAEIRSEIRAALDAHPSGDFPAEVETRLASLEAEAERLNTAERRAGLLTDLEARAPTSPVVETRIQDGDAYAVQPEQRVAEFLARRNGAALEPLSMGRAIRYAVTGKADGAAAEVRAMGTAPATSGGYLLPGEMVSAQLIDLSRNNSVAVAAGAMTVPMTTPDLRFVRVLTDPTAAWRGEGQAITESEGTLGAVMLHSPVLAAMLRVNNEWLADAVNAATMLDQQLAAILALKLDQAALYGSGAGQPLGLRGTPGVNEVSMGTNGAAMTDYDDVLDLIQTVEEANGAPAVAVMAPRTRAKLGKLVTGISGDLTKLTPPAEYTSLRRLVSNQVSITETQGSSNAASTMFLGGFENMAIGIRQDITIEVSRVADDAFAKNQSLIRAIMRADVAVLRPSHFGRLIGIL